MKHKTIHSGYVLILALSILSLASLIIAVVFQKSTVFSPLARLTIKQQKARLLAESGIALASSQLNPVPEESEQKEDEKKKQEPEEKILLKTILPSLNRWQTFTLSEKVDGINGTLRICLMSEEGKININQLYDFEKEQFKGKQTDNKQAQEPDLHKTIEHTFKNIEQKTGQKDLFKQLEAYLKKRKKPLNDITELLEIKGFSYFKDKVFYHPPEKKDEKKRPLFLTDLFTTHTDSYFINPWLFSDSMLGIFNETRAQINDIEPRKKESETWLENVKKNVSWEKDWQQQAGKMLKKISEENQKKFIPLFTQSIDPTVFSVFISATIDNVVQQLFVILEKTKGSQNDKTLYDINIRRLYWL